MICQRCFTRLAHIPVKDGLCASRIGCNRRRARHLKQIPDAMVIKAIYSHKTWFSV